MKVKICGVCRPQDAALAAAAGADYVGVILARKGPRQQTSESARAIYAAAPELMHVGVFADQPLPEVAALAAQLRLDIIQLHGTETAQYIHELECETESAIWKSVFLNDVDDLPKAIDEFADSVDGLLLDSGQGGSGQRFDWTLAREVRQLLNAQVQFVVAGGLNAENVAAAVATMRPDVVDVATGVEEVVGVKSPQKIESFVRNARA